MKKTKEDNGIIDKAWDLQHNLEARQKRIGKGKYGRVLKMARNPTNEEYEKTSKNEKDNIYSADSRFYNMQLYR